MQKTTKNKINTKMEGKTKAKNNSKNIPQLFSGDFVDKVAKLLGEKKIEEAEVYCRNLIKDYPQNPYSWNTLGVVLRHLDKKFEALEVLKKAFELAPNDGDILYNLGVAYNDLYMFEEAVFYYNKSLEITPQRAEAYCNLGNCFRFLKQKKDAIDAYKKAIDIRENYVYAYNNISLIHKEDGELDKATDMLLNALKYAPKLPELHNNLGNVLQHQSKLSEASGCYIKAITLKPDFEEAFNNLLFNLNYDPDKSAEEIFEFYKEYDNRFTLPLAKFQKPHKNSKNLERKLKIGYVSPDFRSHSVSFFLEPLLENHDKSKVQIYAFAEIFKDDEVTQRYKKYVDHWVLTVNMNDEELAEYIRDCEIDILIDLAGHTSKNRLRSFAYKPAPVSISWLGFGYTTGLSAIDYFLCDNIAVPPKYENIFSEKPWRIKNPYFVYRPPIDKMGLVKQLPALKNGYITFGTLSRAIRINQYEIQTWSQLLKMVPNSKLIINSLDYNNPESVKALQAWFETFGIQKDRLNIGYGGAVDVMNQIDIGLDCFPHNSGTTLCEMIYMGIPYVSLSFRPSVGRIGSSILNAIGHQEWIAADLNDYIDKLVYLANDIPKLAILRKTLREEMEKSPLMDEVAYARKLEQAFREMFQRWANG